MPSLGSILAVSASSSPTGRLEESNVETPSVPLLPSPVSLQPCPLFPSFHQGTPTPTPRARRISLPTQPPFAPLAPFAPPAPSSTPVPPATLAAAASVISAMSQNTKNEDLRAARVMLAKLDNFDDEGKPMREAEWRHTFTIATRDLDDKQRAQLWADNLVYEGEAYEWLGNLKRGTTVERADAADWTRLLVHIEKRWPTPKRDPAAWAEQQRRQWDASYLDVSTMVSDLADQMCTTRPHEVWAKQHLAKGRACRSTDTNMVYHTVTHSVPRWVSALLPKKTRYGDTFEELCDDISNIPSRELYDAYCYQYTIQSLVATHLSRVTPPPAPIPAYQPTPRASAMRRQPYAPPPPTPSTPSVQTPIPPPFPIPLAPQSTPRAQHVGFSTVTSIPHPSASRQDPPHMSTPPPRPPTPLQPAQPVERPLRDPLPTVLPNSTEAKAAYKVRVEQWKVANRGRQPSMERPFPLSPGTYEQSRDVCVRCGRGFHFSLECEAVGDAVVAEAERQMRSAILRSLLPGGHSSRGAGSVLGTPTPPPRTFGWKPAEGSGTVGAGGGGAVHGLL